MGTIKDRNGKDLIEAEKIKKRWKEYTKQRIKKWEVTWALGSTVANKASGGMEFQLSYFKS